MLQSHTRQIGHALSVHDSTRGAGTVEVLDDFAAKEKLRGAVSIVPVTAGNDIRPGVQLKANIDNLTPSAAKDGAAVKWYFRETLNSDEYEITPAADGTYTPSEPGYVRIAAANDDYSGEVSSINTYVYGDEWALHDVGMPSLSYIRDLRRKPRVTDTE